MALVYGYPQLVADWVAAQLGDAAPSVDAAIGYVSDGRLKAGVYFDGFTGNNIFAHIASEGPPPKSLLAATAAYAFEQLKLSRMTFAIPEHNGLARNFVERMGCTEECRLMGACGDMGDLVMYDIWRDSPFIVRLLAHRGKTQ